MVSRDKGDSFNFPAEVCCSVEALRAVPSSWSVELGKMNIYNVDSISGISMIM